MRKCLRSQFATHDGIQLIYRHWPAVSSSSGPRQAVLMLHRGHEHSARLSHLVEELDLPEVDFFAWDARGHGESPGERGDAPSFGTVVRDLQTFVEHIADAHGIGQSQLAVLAQSVGAVIAATWVHDYAPNIRGLVLAAPAFKIKLYIPFALPALRLLHRVRGNFFVNSYVKARFLSHDPQRIASYDSDPLIARAISVRMLLGLNDAAKRVVADAQAIKVPTQVLASGADFVVSRRPQRRFFDNLGSAHKEWHLLPGFFHDTLGERDRHLALARVRRFLSHHFEQTAAPLSLLDADRLGASCAEAEALAAPLPAGSLAERYWRTTRAGIAMAAGHSEGLRLGMEAGFDSGSMLDYVYRNQTQGRSPLGRLIDRQYLDAVGWRGIRQRKLHLEELLQSFISRLRAEGRPVHVVDIAAGHGRYLLDAVAQLKSPPDSLLLRDYSHLNVSQGSALIEQRSLAAIARFEQGDAFDRPSLAALEPAPTLAVVSGLYELFADNQQVGQSLAGLADALEPGSYLIYTNQPWHPQLAFIARALTSHRDSQPWVMRRRSQAEMDQLVAAAGFEKLGQRIDEWGIFSVSVARRSGASG